MGKNSGKTFVIVSDKFGDKYVKTVDVPIHRAPTEREVFSAVRSMKLTMDLDEEVRVGVVALLSSRATQADAQKSNLVTWRYFYNGRDEFSPYNGFENEKRFSKAGEPTKSTVAEAIERMRIELQIAYGDDYTFVVLDNNSRVIASHRHGHDHQTFIACTNNKTEGK